MGRRRPIVLGICVVAYLYTGFLFAQPLSPPTPPQSAPTQPATNQSSETQQGEEHFRNAKRLYYAGKFEQAIEEYQQAYLLDPKPDAIYNIAQSYRRAGEITENLEYLRQAKFHFELFLNEVPDTPYKKDIKILIKEIDKLLDRLGKKRAEKERLQARERERLQTKLAQGGVDTGTNEALQLILGRDYVPFLASGLTLEGYLDVKRGKRNTMIGGYLFSSGLLVSAGGAFLLLSQRFKGARDIRFLGAGSLALGGFATFTGGILIPYGIFQRVSGEKEKRIVSPSYQNESKIVLIPYINSDSIGLFAQVGFF